MLLNLLQNKYSNFCIHYLANRIKHSRPLLLILPSLKHCRSELREPAGGFGDSAVFCANFLQHHGLDASKILRNLLSVVPKQSNGRRPAQVSYRSDSVLASSRTAEFIHVFSSSCNPVTSAVSAVAASVEQPYQNTVSTQSRSHYCCEFSVLSNEFLAASKQILSNPLPSCRG